MNFSIEEWDRRFKDWQIRRRNLRQIEAALPEAIDLLAIITQAGLDFQVALHHFVQAGPAGALRDELQTVQTEIQLGQSRVQALKNLAKRVPAASIKEMVQTVVQGIELGSSLAPLLKEQAQALRLRRSYEAEKRAAKAPLKLMFPLFVFILPTIFLILFGPLALTILRGEFQ